MEVGHYSWLSWVSSCAGLPGCWVGGVQFGAKWGWGSSKVVHSARVPTNKYLIGQAYAGRL